MLLSLAIACHAGEALGLDSLSLEAPGYRTHLEAGGVVTVTGQGFAARLGTDRALLLTGEALRFDKQRDSLSATGSIVFVLPGIRIHADRIGLHPDKFRQVGDAVMRGAPATVDPGEVLGDAWQVEAWFESGSHHIHVRAEHLEMHSDRMTFHGVIADFGHGGSLSFNCPRLHVYLRDKARMDKSEEMVARYIEGVAAIRPSIRVAGVPVLWLPYIYRDYILDYPWSTLEAGHRKRLGTWVRYRIGSNLREMGGWRTRIEGRLDRYSRAGNGYGLNGYWKHATYGRGSTTFYRMENENVVSAKDETIRTGQRWGGASDNEHYVSDKGWAVAARYTNLPNADPSLILPIDRAPDERFRTDYLRDELSEKPFARQGVVGTWVLPWMSFTVDTERRPNDRLNEAERWVGVEAVIPKVSLIGPLAIEGRAWFEELNFLLQQTSAERTTWDTALSATSWFGGNEADIRVGFRGVRWDNGRINAVEIQSHHQLFVPFMNAGTAIRLTANAGEVNFILSPRIGVEAVGTLKGNGNPGFNFYDGRDFLDQNRRYLSTGADFSVYGGGRVLNVASTARWALRHEDREARDFDGTYRVGSSSLADVAYSIRGIPHPDIEIDSVGTWDARLARWTAFDSRAQWQVTKRIDLLYNGIYAPRTALSEHRWLHRAGSEVRLSRYILEGWVELRPDIEGTPKGTIISMWHVGFSRRMIDGTMNLGFERATLPVTGELDHRFAFQFSVGGDERDAKRSIRPAFGF
ncbi:MAG: hypothetical protein AAB263_15440 [Planctomycetota bacterium]